MLQGSSARKATSTAQNRCTFKSTTNKSTFEYALFNMILDNRNSIPYLPICVHIYLSTYLGTV